MRSLLEKTIVHLLNGDEEKAAALFHKFMVDKARQVHESLRQDEEIDLGEGWDTEMKEEEYFDDGDLAADEPLAGDDAPGDSMEDLEDMNTVDDDGTGDTMVDPDPDADVGMDDMDGMDGGGTVDEKLDNIEAKIEELTAEFDRLMGKFEDEGDLGDDDLGDDLGDADLPDTGDDFEDVDGEEPSMDAGDTDDLADRFDSDLGDDDKPESDTLESVDMDESGEELDEDLADITESVLSELDKITLPSNTDGKEIGSGGKSISGNRSSMLPHHNINDRIEGAKPYLVKGGNNDSFEREAAPPTKPISTVVPDVRKGNVRNSFKDGMSAVPAKGDNSALLNKDHAGSEPSPGSIIDGKVKPKTK